MKTRYDLWAREHEMRSRHGLVDSRAQQDYEDRIHSLGQEFLETVLTHQTDRGLNSLNAVVKWEKNFMTSVPAALIGVLVLSCSGTPVEILSKDEAKITLRSRLAEQKGQLKVRSAIVDGSLEVANNAAEEDDRYKVSVSRGIPILQMTSDVSYGSASNALSASLSKQLTRNLSVMLASTRAPRLPRESLVFNYRIDF